MLRSPSFRSIAAVTLILLATIQTVSAHFQIVYPAWRANTLHDNLQWEYPCGGQNITTNRTAWPVTGGPISVIPGWNAGHPTSFFYINMGYGSDPPNMTNPMQTIFQLVGASAGPFPGEFCLPDVQLPKNFTAKVGDNATIQVIQVALHGASLYNCADITFVDKKDADPAPDGMCTNSSTVGFNLVYTTTSDAYKTFIIPSVAVFSSLFAIASVWLL